MADFSLTGVGVALPTPFKKDGSIDFLSLENLINHVISGGVNYIVALGTTAETPTLTKDEKYKIAGFINEVVSLRVPLVIGIGGNNTKAVVIKTETFDLKGYSAILSVTPYYNKPSQEGLFYHFKEIVDKSPLPIILYNVPSRTGVNLSAETTLKLAAYSSKFCGIKEASGNKDQCKEIIERSPENFSLVSGDDATTLELMKLGAKGVISVLANAFPSQVKKLADCLEEQKIKESEDCHNSIKPLFGPLFEDGNPAGIKALLNQLGICENILRLPLVPASKEVQKKLEISAYPFIEIK